MIPRLVELLALVGHPLDSLFNKLIGRGYRYTPVVIVECAFWGVVTLATAISLVGWIVSHLRWV